MAKTFLTISGVTNYYGLIPFQEGQVVFLKKEPDNIHDAEAIAVRLPYIGTVGYVANSPRSVVRGTMSGGRIYDRFGDESVARVIFITDTHMICRLLSAKKANAYLKRYDAYAEQIRSMIEEDPNDEDAAPGTVGRISAGPINITPLWEK